MRFFVQSCPVSGQYRPDGWSDGKFFHFKTDGIKFRFDPYTIHAYPISQFLKVSGHTYIRTDKQTNILIILIYKTRASPVDFTPTGFTAPPYRVHSYPTCRIYHSEQVFVPLTSFTDLTQELGISIIS